MWFPSLSQIHPRWLIPPTPHLPWPLPFPHRVGCGNTVTELSQNPSLSYIHPLLPRPLEPNRILSSLPAINPAVSEYSCSIQGVQTPMRPAGFRGVLPTPPGVSSPHPYFETIHAVLEITSGEEICSLLWKQNDECSPLISQYNFVITNWAFLLLSNHWQKGRLRIDLPKSENHSY